MATTARLWLSSRAAKFVQIAMCHLSGNNGPRRQIRRLSLPLMLDPLNFSRWLDSPGRTLVS